MPSSITPAHQSERDDLFLSIMAQLEANIGNRLQIERGRIKALTQSSLIKLSKEASQIRSYQELKQWLSDNEPSVVRGDKVEKKQLEL